MASDFTPRLMAGIVPGHTSLAQRTVASNVDRLLDLDVERVRHLWNPWLCHEDDLPYLAWALSVDLWKTSWPLLKKRSVIANAVKLHQLKGTLEGLEQHLAIVDVSVDRVTTPSDKIFSGPSLTRAEREAWLEDLPQVRMYFSPGTAQFQSSAYSTGSLAKSFMGLDFLVPSTAQERYSRHAAYVVDGVDTNAIVDQDGSVIQIHIPGTLPDSSFCGTTLTPSYMGLDFFMPSTASQRIVSIAPVSYSPWRVSVGPSLVPVTSEPELVTQQGDAGIAVFSGEALSQNFFLPSSASQRVFERYAIDDGRSVKKRPSIQFMGLDRYGMPGHTAEAKVRIRSKRPEIQAGEGLSYPGTQFWLPHDPKPLNEACDAANVSRRLSDDIFLDTKTPSGFFAGLPFTAGKDSFVV